MSTTQSKDAFPRRGQSLRSRLSWRRDKRLTQSLKYRAGEAKSQSSPDLFSEGTKYHIFNDGVMKVHRLCDVSNLNIFHKLLQYTRSLRTWESHNVILNEDGITSETPTGLFDTFLPYSSIVQVVAVDLSRQPINCVKVSTNTFSILLQANNQHQRDKCIHSLKWRMEVYKYKVMLLNTIQPDVILQKLEALVDLTLASRLHLGATHIILLNLVTMLLVKKPNVMNSVPRDCLIIVVAKLFVRVQPSREICAFFTNYCRQCPRSTVIVDCFEFVIHNILKYNVDFGKRTWLRTFAIEYIQTLNASNDRKVAVEKFVHSMHGHMSLCPHGRILNNLIAVCLSGIYQCFSKDSLNGKRTTPKHKKSKHSLIPSSHSTGKVDCALLNNNVNKSKLDAKNLKNVREQTIKNKSWTNDQDEKFLNTENVPRGDPNLKETYARTDKRLSFVLHQHDDQHVLTEDELEKLAIFVEVFKEICNKQDWCPGLASLLQPLPFPEEAMRNIQFTRLMYPVIERFAEDDREDVVRCLLYSREDKDGWLQVYSPGGRACEDDGRLFSKMVEALLQPGIQTGKLKKFMTSLASNHFEVVIMLALRENPVMIKVLKDMLQMAVLPDEQEQLQAVSTLRCTPSGKAAYKELKSQLSILNQTDGPKAFTLAPNSTDADLNTLLGTGSWGSLESLDLSFTHVTSQSIDVIVRLPNLKYLDLWATNIDDRGLCTLCDYLDLKSLNICETRVTNEGIQCLEAMKNLEYVNLNSTKLSSSTFINLQKNLPNLVQYDIGYTDAEAEADI